MLFIDTNVSGYVLTFGVSFGISATQDSRATIHAPTRTNVGARIEIGGDGLGL